MIKILDKLFYSEEKKYLYFIEIVTSVELMELKCIKEIEEKMSAQPSLTSVFGTGKIYVTSFLGFKTFKKFSETLAWETEVWIADVPNHMIYLNDDLFHRYHIFLYHH